MKAIQEYIWATAVVLILRTVFADAQPAPNHHGTPNHGNGINSVADPIQLPPATDSVEPTRTETDVETANPEVLLQKLDEDHVPSLSEDHVSYINVRVTQPSPNNPDPDTNSVFFPDTPLPTANNIHHATPSTHALTSPAIHPRLIAPLKPLQSPTSPTPSPSSPVDFWDDIGPSHHDSAFIAGFFAGVAVGCLVYLFITSRVLAWLGYDMWPATLQRSIIVV